MKWSKENPRVIVLVVVLFVSGFLLGKLSKTAQTKPLQDETVQPSVARTVDSVLLEFSELRIYPSLDGEFSTYIYPLNNEKNEYIYGIINKAGAGTYKINQLIENNTFECYEPVAHDCIPFMKWVKGNKFVHKNSQLEIIDAKKVEKEIYDYDKSKYNFVDVNKTLEYWLFEKKDSEYDTKSYVILNRDKKVVRDNIDFLSSNKALYDEVNDGFVFITGIYSSPKKEQVSMQIDFLSLKNMTLRNILMTDPAEVPARECCNESLESEPGEIFLYSGCLLIVDEKYLDSQWRVHIKL